VKLEWVPDAVAPHVKRLVDAIGAHVHTVTTEAIDRAIAALAAPSPAAPATRAADQVADRILKHHLGPELAAMVMVDRDTKPENVIPPSAVTVTPPAHRAKWAQNPRPRLKPTAALEASKERRDQADQVAADPPRTEPAAISPLASERATNAYTLAAAKARIAERVKDRTVRRKAKLAAKREIPDDNPNASVRWSPERIAASTEHTESLKKRGSLPLPSATSTFTVTPVGGDAIAEIHEVELPDSEAW
jgi:hypothetical protein